MAFPGSVTADIETATASGTGDVVDDPAILIHPTTPSSSVIVTTNKDYTNGGIYVYDLGGTLVESESVGNAYNNVDVRYDFGGFDNIIGATGRESGDLHFWNYDYSDTADEMTAIGTIDTGYSTEPYGFTMGRLGEKYYAFASADDGTQVKQWELSESGGVISGTLVRTLSFSGQVEGMVTDDVNGYFYAAEEDGAIKRFSTDPGAGGTHVVVDDVSGNLTQDIEGLAIYYTDDPDEGYLIASSQGSDQYAVYERTGSNDYLGKFTMSGNGSTIDGATDTDGLDVTNVNLGGNFDEGLFVVHDNDNTGGNSNSNFKLVEWDEIATLGGLVIDTADSVAYDPRASVSGTPSNPTAPPPPAFFTINTTDASVTTFTGTSGNDTLTGTSAAEKFDGLTGADTYNGGLGDDFYVIENSGDNIASDGGGQDTEEIWGTFNRTLATNSEHAVVQGSTTRTITGNADNNIMTAAGSGSGTVTLLGLTGDDNIRVGARDTIATGGADNDIFRYNTSSTGAGNSITDFTWGEDLIDASPLVAGSYAPTSNPFSNGVLSLVDSGSDVKLRWDQDGSANSTIAAVDVVTIVGVQIDDGINNAHIYTGL